MTTRPPRKPGTSSDLTSESLRDYVKMRNFDVTSEPRGATSKTESAGKISGHSFVIQKHHARNLHYDFRLELGGTLKSWAVPKGPSLDPTVKRLAVHVEDHPLEYASFEGAIPKGEYGAGNVIVWDKGEWIPEGDPEKAYRDGKLSFELKGIKLSGRWNLVRTRFKGDKAGKQWLLIKDDDDAAVSAKEYEVTELRPESVAKKSSDQVPERVDIPSALKPQLATPMQRLPAGHWSYELKFDGYRLLARFQQGRVNLFTRSGYDWTKKLPQLARTLGQLALEDSWLDGEIVILNDKGLPDFQALQNAFDAGRSQNIIYYLFDAPFINGQDLRDLPLTDRRAALQDALKGADADVLRLSEAFDTEDYRDIYQSACAMSLEGIIAKRPDSPYRSSRTADWVKLKCLTRQEFVIVGFTEPEGARNSFGAMLLGLYQADGSGELHYAGRVGTGFSETRLRQIAEKLRPLQRPERPLKERVAASGGVKIRWVVPVLVCEVEFSNWTDNNRIRHGVFIALREDKSAKDVVLDVPQTAADELTLAKPTKRKNKIAGVTISSPDRVLDSVSGYQKIQLAEFYHSISKWIMPHLKNRPVSILRAPEGLAGEQFFQKHAEHLAIPGIKHLPAELDPGHARLMEIDSAGSLVGAVQMGGIEFHTWGATSAQIENPDRIILDLDPDPKLSWQTMIEATQLVANVLDELGLESFLKTSGGRGMHIVIPIARTLDWTEAKSFAKAISSFMRQQLPERFTDKMGPKNRIGKIFIDYLRNSRGASTVTAFSVRARPGLPVSVPIDRKELSNLRSAQQWTVLNLLQRLKNLAEDPWSNYNHRQRISKKMWDRLG